MTSNNNPKRSDIPFSVEEIDDLPEMPSLIVIALCSIAALILGCVIAE